jgi:glycosyltransferase involved in cell wall biosynthesis
MKIAWFTPFNAHSAIGHYSEAVVTELAKTDEVVLYASDAPRASHVGPAAVVALGEGGIDGVLRELKSCDVAVYNMGNHMPYHKHIYEVLMRHPGVVVLHDLVLRDFFFGYFLQEKRAPLTLARQMVYGEGPEAENMARSFLIGRHSEAPDDPIRLRFPMFRSALHRCEGVIVHSEYSRGRVAAAVSAPVAKLDFPLFGPAAVRLGARGEGRGASNDQDSDDNRTDDSSLAPRKVRLLTFGVLVPNKQVHAVVAGIASSEFLRRHVEYVVVGEGEAAYVARLRLEIERHGLTRTVRLTGRLSDERLLDLLAHADVVVNLRNPHFGESSASLLDALLTGAPSIVWDHGYYAEFPDDVVCKVSSESDLKAALERLCRDADLRQRMGRQARAHALARFNTAAFCQGLREFLVKVRSGRPVLALTDLVSDRLLEFGPRPPDGLPERLAAEIAAMAGEAA